MHIMYGYLLHCHLLYCVVGPIRKKGLVCQSLRCIIFYYSLPNSGATHGIETDTS